jgi:hypothetical protein
MIVRRLRGHAIDLLIENALTSFTAVFSVVTIIFLFAIAILRVD